MGNGVQMGKIKRHSLKWSLIKFFLPCVILSIVGILFIGHGTNYLQEWYRSSREFEILHWGSQPYRISRWDDAIYFIISNAQVILIPLWPFLCMGFAANLFYHFDLKPSIDILLSASQKIAENQMDFTIKSPKDNELGDLCQAFESMRSNLYLSNLEMWRSLEERKRLNAAFSHDLRIPLTVLQGYADFLQKYVPTGKVTEEKLLDVLALMGGQILRLKHYTFEMNSLQKLEDILPNPRNVSLAELEKMLSETGNIACASKNFQLISPETDKKVILNIDTELMIQVYENMLSNAVRYARSHITTSFFLTKNMLCINVCDDGGGFSPEALLKADAPFFRDEKEEDRTHFGLGLYICRVLCEKCGGRLTIANGTTGGNVTAEFCCQ